MNQQDTLVETTGVNLLRIFFSSLWELTLTVKRRFFFRGSFEGLEKQQMKLSLRELTNSEVTFAVCVFRMWLLIYRQRKLNEGIVRVSWRIRSFCVTNIRSSRVQPIWLDAAEKHKQAQASTSKLSERRNVKENMLFSIKEKQVHHKNRWYCLKTKFYWQTKQRKQIKARWLTSLYLSYFNRDFLQQFSTEIPDSIFFSRLHIIKGELGGNGYTWVSSIKGHRFFFFINVLFYRCFLHGFYTESGPELQKKFAWKGQNFKTKLFSLL